MAARHWGDLTTGDLAGRDLARTVAVLPVAATEQHGPHLPLSTDTTIARGYLDRVAALTPPDLDVLILPIQTVGKSDEHDAFPGTLTLSAGTALAAWTEIGEGVARTGCRRLVLVTSHGGNSPLIDLVAGELRRRFGILAVTTSWARLGVPAGLFSEGEIAHGIHAGGIETALMLALRPDLVRLDKVADFPSRGRAMADSLKVLRTGRPAGFAWKTGDLNPSGAVGDARLGTAKAGHTLLDHGARVFVDLLGEVSEFDL